MLQNNNAIMPFLYDYAIKYSDTCIIVHHKVIILYKTAFLDIFALRC